jgi:CubicO group peptidase (beta-lactamase class C family)
MIPLVLLLAMQVPAKAWPESTPQAQGLDPAVLEALDRELAAGQQGYVDSMLVIRHGKVVYEKSYPHMRDYDRLFSDKGKGKGAPGIYNYYDPDWHPYYPGTALHTMQSITKSVTSALIGIAIGRGHIPSVDVKVMPYFSGFHVAADPRRARMTLRDLLTMRAGIRWDEESVDYTNPANNCAAMEGREDWIQYVLDQPMATEPGKAFVYNSGATQLLSYLIHKATGKSVDAYAKEHLFGPLGIDFSWKRTPMELSDTEGGLYLTPRDLAKIGYLYMKDGVWEGQRILPEGWVKASTASVTATNEKGIGYGYQWWVLPPTSAAATRTGAFLAWGYGGQLLIVAPELELIAVFTGWNIYDKPELDPRLAYARVLAAVKDKP